MFKKEEQEALIINNEIFNEKKILIHNITSHVLYVSMRAVDLVKG